MIEKGLIPLVAARFKALGEPGRLSILAALQDGEMNVSELAEATGRSQPNVSQHLASLLKAGLVAARRDGNRVPYRICDPYLERICAAVCESVAKSAAEQSRRLQAALKGRPRTGRRA
jgi:ArsR family transcriptional regulator